MIVKKWSPKFSLFDELKYVPIWVRFHSLPVLYWGTNNLSRIARTIGVPSKMDDTTLAQSRLSYARVLVEQIYLFRYLQLLRIRMRMVILLIRLCLTNGFHLFALNVFVLAIFVEIRRLYLPSAKWLKNGLLNSQKKLLFRLFRM